MVCTTRKSTETTCAEWYLQERFPALPGCSWGFLWHGMYHSTVDSEMSNPSFNISPWIRGAPQSGLSCAFCLMRSICACGSFGLPLVCLLIHLQYNLNPCRCHRMTVSGLMIGSVSSQELKTSVFCRARHSRSECR